MMKHFRATCHVPIKEITSQWTKRSLSKARRVVENALGIMASQFLVFYRLAKLGKTRWTPAVATQHSCATVLIIQQTTTPSNSMTLLDFAIIQPLTLYHDKNL